MPRFPRGAERTILSELVSITMIGLTLLRSEYFCVSTSVNETVIDKFQKVSKFCESKF